MDLSASVYVHCAGDGTVQIPAKIQCFSQQGQRVRWLGPARDTNLLPTYWPLFAVHSFYSTNAQFSITENVRTAGIDIQ